MKSFWIFFFLIYTCLTIDAQQLAKPVLDTTVFDNWLSVGNIFITNDGKYVTYSVHNKIGGDENWIVQALDGSFNLTLDRVSNVTFTNDSKSVVFNIGNDSLGVCRLGDTSIRYIYPATEFKLCSTEKEELLFYMQPEQKHLVRFSISNGARKSYSSVLQFYLSTEGKALVLKQKTADAISIKWLDLASDSEVLVDSDSAIGDILMDQQGKKLAYLIHHHDGGNKLFCYQRGKKAPVELTQERYYGENKELEIGNLRSFSRDGNRLFIDLTERELTLPSECAVKVDVSTYFDPKLQSVQLLDADLNTRRNFLAVIETNGGKQVLQLQKSGENVVDIRSSNILLNTQKGDPNEWNWSGQGKPEFTLVSTTSGNRKILNIKDIEITQDDQFVIGRDLKVRDIYCYEIASDTLRNITQSILPNLAYDADGQRRFTSTKGLFYDGMLTGYHLLLIHDDYDMWLVDPLMKKKPICLTNGYGRKNKILFRLAESSVSSAIENNTIILSAFNSRTKDNGFYRASIAKVADPEKLIMGPYLYYSPYIGGLPILKARDQSIYVLTRECSSQSPNFFWSRDMKTISPISHISPEIKFNWMTSQLINFKTLNGISTQGILYKPEDFNPGKKYPVIFNYYEQLSNELNKYHVPYTENGHLDIPWFVSNGYLVFVPDIHYRRKQLGQSAYNTVVAAANFLAGLSFVDNKRMGLQGHSFGGYETNYLITHTSIFAAAVSSSGMSELIEDYFETWGTGVQKGEWYDNRSGRMGIPPWSNPNLYIANSPIFAVAKINTPVLLINNHDDYNVRYQQGLNFFEALRRLGKKAWMLQYDGQGHGLYGNARRDYIIRTTQFFDYFLKDTFPPKWMTKGIPANKKGLDCGLGLEKSKGLPDGLNH